MSSIPKRLLTPAEYLAIERRAAFKSEFYQGEMFAMAGATREHNLVVGNLVAECNIQLRQRRCEVYPSDMRVKIPSTGLYCYPDVTIVCGEPKFEDDQFDTLINPTVVFEVLSESTEAYDRGTKSTHYRKLALLKAYVLVATDRPQVESHHRQPDGGWLIRDAAGLEDSLAVESIGLQLPLAEIYRRVTFEVAPAPTT